VDARHATKVSEDIVLLFWKRLTEHNGKKDMLIFEIAVNFGEKCRLGVIIFRELIQGK